MRTVERFAVRGRVFHWVHSAAFLALLVTGMILYIPGLGFLASGSTTRIIHRAAAVVFMVAPLLYLVVGWRAALQSLREVLTWTMEDVRWFFAAPFYYFFGDDSLMPPQGEYNTGQKLYFITALTGGLVFAATGLVMWFGRGFVNSEIFQATVIIHDLATIGVTSFLFVHLYLSVLHPKMTESFGSMWHGRVSTKYASSHYGKWFARVTSGAHHD